MNITIDSIIGAIQKMAPTALQESYDNSGLQLGDSSRECTGVLLCVDVTPERVDEAVARGCNLIVAHHPLLFHGLKQITGATPQQQAVIRAIESGVAIYCAHTSLDNAPGGVNAWLARDLGLDYLHPLMPISADMPDAGAGAVATSATPLTALQLVERVKKACASPVCRCTEPPAGAVIERVAMCGGSGGSMLPDAIAAGAQAYVTSDVRYHDFLDFGDRIFIIDIGHFESESCTKRIFHHIITQNFPNFAVHYSDSEKNPINYI